ncbi:MAG TPA: insulinase family protein [Opitutaceae bacterium]|nr:insulinase family protein [Opitutaceae bacterium]HND60241.1 insulinase family protein [Opitutaceae bacterium]
MRLSLLPRLLPFLALTVLVRAVTPSTPPTPALPTFAQAASDLAADPAAKFGTLPNGFRYVILPNHEPKGRASLRLLVLAGSLHETEEQRGLAHFLEHMAFNGGDHFKPGTLVEFFQRMGMSFGGDTNANTSFDRTLYLLELPDTKEATLAEGFSVLADDAGGLLLPAEMVEKERGIILSEKRARDSVGFRIFLSQFETTLGTTLFPKRVPIGDVNVIEHAPRERFVDFWNTWYRPERMAVIVVGDVDVAQVERMVTETFSRITARAPARPEPDRGQVAEFTGVRTNFCSEPEAPNTSVSITMVTPYAFEPDTAANRLKDLPRSVAISMLNRRLAELAKKENAPFTDASASASENFDLFRSASIDVNCKPEQWTAALAVGDQELRRALEHGFSAAELHEVVASYLNGLDQSVKSASTRHSDRLANEIAEGILHREVFTTPAAEQALYAPALAKLTVDDCLAALRKAFSAPGRYVLVAGNAKIPGDANAAIAAAYAQSQQVAVAAPAAAAEQKWAYTDFGPAGQVTKRKHVEDLDLYLVEFANGVRLNLKKTDFEAGRIRLSARVGYGLLSEPADQRGLALFSGNTFDLGGLGKHSVDDLRRILAGHTVGVGLRMGPDAIDFGGLTTRDELVLELQLLAAKLTDPGYRPEAQRQARKALEQAYIAFAHTPQGPLATEVASLVASGDPRFGMPAKEVMLSRTLEESRAWLTPQLTHGPLELAIVGDLDVEATIDAVARTLGALPAREARVEHAEWRHLVFPAQSFTKDYSIQSEIPKGVVRLYWPSSDGMEARRARRLNMLAAVLQDRLRVKVREEVGGTYSPGAGSNASDTFPGYGYFAASVDVAPDAAAKMAGIVLAAADDLAQHGVTEDQLTRAKQPGLTALRESLRANPYWLGSVLSRAQEKPEVLDWCRNRIADVESISAAEVSALAKQYLSRDRASTVTILPKK